MKKLFILLFLCLNGVELAFGAAGQIMDANDANNAYYIATPYDGNEIANLQYVQSADVMYFVDGTDPVYKLSRTSHADWTMTEVNFTRGPFKAENLTTTTIEPNATTGSITLNASSTAMWDANHIGALWQITHTIGANSVNASFAADGNSSSVTVLLDQYFDFSTHSVAPNWTGTVILQKSYDNGTTWKDVIPVHYENDGNIQYSEKEIVADAIYRVHMESWSSGTCNYSLIARSFDVHGVVKITQLTDANTVTATVINTLGGTSATKYWAEGAWSIDEGYPQAIAFYEERLVFAATKNQPQTIWCSETDNWESFNAGTNDTSALVFTIASDQLDSIRWMISQNCLLVGTASGEWKLSAAEGADAPMNPANIMAKRQSSYGSARIQPKIMNNVVLFVQRMAKKIRELVYSYELDTWIAPDLTVLSEHITGSGITEMAFQKTPDPILWCVRSDGTLSTMTYNREQEVVAWSRQITDGEFESVAIIPGDGEDEVWVVVKRTIDGSTVRYIEQFQPRDWGTDDKDIFFVDSGLTFDGGAAVTITGISQANPCVVTAVGHGETDGNQIRISGVSGMTQVNGKVYTVHTVVDVNSFQIRDKTDAVDINSVAFTTYISGGSVEQVENNFTTLGHLEGETVAVIADGSYYGTEVVDNNTITLDDYYNKVHAGLNYTAKLLPQRLEIPGARTEGRTKRVTAVTVRFYDTLACKIGNSWTNWDNVVFSESTDPNDTATPLFNGDRKIDFGGDYDTAGNIYIQNDLPVPCTVLCVIPELEVYR